MPRKRSGSCVPRARFFDGGQRRDRLHQGFAGAARLRDRDKARGGERQLFEQRAVGLGIEVVHEVQARGIAEERDACDRVSGKLRERLPAEARAAGAEEHDVGRTAPQLRAARVTILDVVPLFRQAQEAEGRHRHGAPAANRARLAYA